MRPADGAADAETRGAAAAGTGEGARRTVTVRAYVVSGRNVRARRIVLGSAAGPVARSREERE